MGDRTGKPVAPLTLDDIATAIGVSRTTVSNAFNRPDQLSHALREKVLGAAREMGYPGPNPLARNLRTGRAGAIGLVFSEVLTYAFSDPTTVAFLQGVARVCEPAEAALLILPATDPVAAQKTVRQAAVDGFLVYCMPKDSPVAMAVLDRRLPVVAVDHPALEGVPGVGIDDREAARVAAAHLVDLGHRYFACISMEVQDDRYVGPLTQARQADAAFHTSIDRLAGYEDALRAGGIDPSQMETQERPGNSEDGGFDAACLFLSKRPRPTAILAMSDRLAIGALRAAEHMGLLVPDDVSVIGFDDIPDAAHARPPLTTIRQPLIDKGAVAVEMLLAGAKGPSRLLETELIRRGSTGPAPAFTGGVDADGG